MSARLDTRFASADFSGGVSDPRLVNRLSLIGPNEPMTLEKLALALDVVADYAGKKKLSAATHATLNQMIFGHDTPEHQAKEAA